MDKILHYLDCAPRISKVIDQTPLMIWGDWTSGAFPSLWQATLFNVRILRGALYYIFSIPR